uniref:Uncharacterized protein n=1 Tax=Cacopsylla melanoneura TaxID=428564 RepID=A0A8D8T607_9HEMI
MVFFSNSWKNYLANSWWWRQLYLFGGSTRRHTNATLPDFFFVRIYTGSYLSEFLNAKLSAFLVLASARKLCVQTKLLTPDFLIFTELLRENAQTYINIQI